MFATQSPFALSVVNILKNALLSLIKASFSSCTNVSELNSDWSRIMIKESKDGVMKENNPSHKTTSHCDSRPTLMPSKYALRHFRSTLHKASASLSGRLRNRVLVLLTLYISFQHSCYHDYPHARLSYVYPTKLMRLCVHSDQTNVGQKFQNL